MKYETTLVIPLYEFGNAMKHLNKSRPFDDAGQDECRYTWTATFSNNIEVDLEVVNAPKDGGGPWTQAVLFERGLDGIHFCEIACSEPSEDLLGDWHFFVEDNEYILNVEKGN